MKWLPGTSIHLPWVHLRKQVRASTSHAPDLERLVGHRLGFCLGSWISSSFQLPSEGNASSGIITSNTIAHIDLKGYVGGGTYRIRILKLLRLIMQHSEILKPTLLWEQRDLQRRNKRSSVKTKSILLITGLLNLRVLAIGPLQQLHLEVSWTHALSL